jgi:hypothetical protein
MALMLGTLIQACTPFINFGSNAAFDDPALGPCPSLAGEYVEAGQYDDGSGKGHLTSIVTSGLDKGSVLRTPAAPGKPSTYFVASVRMVHPSADKFVMDALDENGATLARFSLGSEEGWKCDGQSFFHSKRHSTGNEAGTGYGISRQRVMKDGNDLVRVDEDWFWRGGLLSLSVPIGEPMHRRSVSRYRALK